MIAGHPAVLAFDEIGGVVLSVKSAVVLIAPLIVFLAGHVSEINPARAVPIDPLPGIEVRR